MTNRSCAPVPALVHLRVTQPLIGMLALIVAVAVAVPAGIVMVPAAVALSLMCNVMTVLPLLATVPSDALALTKVEVPEFEPYNLDESVKVLTGPLAEYGKMVGPTMLPVRFHALPVDWNTLPDAGLYQRSPARPKAGVEVLTTHWLPLVPVAPVSPVGP